MTDTTKPEAGWQAARAFVAECAGFQGQMVHGNWLSSEAEKVLAIIDALLASPSSLVTPSSGDKRDAERYRWLRQQHWDTSRLFVITGPKPPIQIGTYCPNLDLLDAAIDGARQRAEDANAQARSAI